jgi:hypothetical protein
MVVNASHNLLIWANFHDNMPSYYQHNTSRLIDNPTTRKHFEHLFSNIEEQQGNHYVELMG